MAKTLRKKDEIDLWKNLKELSFDIKSNHISRSQQDVLETHSSWVIQVCSQKYKSKDKYFQNNEEREAAYQQIVRFLSNERQ